MMQGSNTRASPGGLGYTNNPPFGKNHLNWLWKFATGAQKNIFEIDHENPGFWENDHTFQNPGETHENRPQLVHEALKVNYIYNIYSYNNSPNQTEVNDLVPIVVFGENVNFCIL
jgi:hypothetical protein